MDALRQVNRRGRHHRADQPAPPRHRAALLRPHRRHAGRPRDVRRPAGRADGGARARHLRRLRGRVRGRGAGPWAGDLRRALPGPGQPPEPSMFRRTFFCARRPWGPASRPGLRPAPRSVDATAFPAPGRRAWAAQVPQIRVGLLAARTRPTGSAASALSRPAGETFGVPVRLYFAADYAGVMQAFGARQIELAGMGPAPPMPAPGSTPMAASSRCW
jgi:hypothetical protein